MCVKMRSLGKDQELCTIADEDGTSETRKAWRAQHSRTRCASCRQGCRLSHTCSLLPVRPMEPAGAPWGFLCTSVLLLTPAPQQESS